MKNTKLGRDVDGAKDVFDDLIKEIEDLEYDIIELRGNN